MMNIDPTITRIRTVRHHISEQYHHDVQQLIDHYIEREQHHQGRFIELTTSLPFDTQQTHPRPTQVAVETAKEHLMEHRECS